MSPWLEWGIPVITWLQSLGDWLIAPMQLITFLGDEKFYLLILPIFLWCVDVGLGVRIGLIYIFSASLNVTLKLLLGSPRPYWVSSQVKTLSTATDYGLPSGHSQNAMTVYGRIAIAFGRAWGYIALGVLIFLIAVSRMHLAVHFPTDVLLGLFLGILFLFFFVKLEKPIAEWLKRISLGNQILVAFLASLFILGVGLGTSALTAGRSVPADWISTAAAAVPDADPIHPRNLRNFVVAAGALFGIGAGIALLFGWGKFDPRGPWLKRAGRYAIGVVGVFILYFGLSQIFPSGETTLAHTLRYLRYATVGFWAAYLAPRLFVAIKLA